jgi:hypothetical protein
LLKPYLEKKDDKMKTIRENLYEKLKELDTPSPLIERNKLISQLKEKVGASKTAELIGLSRQQVHNIVSNVNQYSNTYTNGNGNEKEE